MPMHFRTAHKEDVPRLVALLADDPLGQAREDFREPLPQAYFDAFDEIDADPNQELIAAVNAQGEIVGTLQLSYMRYLTYQGGLRAQIEAVRIRRSLRGQGLGRQLFEWAIGRARARGAHVLQLTTDKKRQAALKFYLELGFKASHEGMKMHFK